MMHYYNKTRYYRDVASNVLQRRRPGSVVVLLMLLVSLFTSNHDIVTKIHCFTIVPVSLHKVMTTTTMRKIGTNKLPTSSTKMSLLQSIAGVQPPPDHITITSTTAPTTTTTPPPTSNVVNDDDDNRNRIWMFRDIYPISYDRSIYTSYHTSPSTTNTVTSTTTKILLLNGFGMGTFHQHRLMKEIQKYFHDDDNNNEIDMSKKNQYDTITNTIRDNITSATTPSTDTDTTTTTTTTTIFEVYAMDYIGQGQSWPIHCQKSNNSGTLTTTTEIIGLQYSAQTWMEQIISFIEQAVFVENISEIQQNVNNSANNNNKVHLVGNSLGGYLATYVAATRPDLITSLILLNATPIWGLNLPFWSGHLPSPILPKLIGSTLFDIMRSKYNIQQFLNITYVNDPMQYHPTLVNDIQSCTNDPGGHDAFTSILWSPPISIPKKSLLLDHHHDDPTIETTTNFYDCMERVQCPVLLCYGQKDPWCKPAFAKQILQRLQQQEQRDTTSTTTYVELSNVGHCPNHEAPVATAMVIMKWIQQQQQQQQQMTNGINDSDQRSLFHDKQIIVEETWGSTIVQERNADEIPLDWMDQIAVAML